ncbi:helix-turn-helix domain-containing protein [Microbacterium sp. LWH7-1.2]|uniref:sigma factor-like helix-turn-helix DNA-binding protein n=1 Tax=Microbacterium sp. LWH7-1.2 TaxID=3135257 RepID=UPI00313A170E
MTIVDEEWTFSTESDARSLVTDWLPRIRPYVLSKFGWLERRGNCMVTADDLIQVASIALMRHAERWGDHLADSLGVDPDTAFDGGENAGLFWTTLREDVERAIYRYRHRDARDDEFMDSFDNVGEDGESDAEKRTSLRTPGTGVTWGVVRENVMDYYLFLPQRDRVMIALRYFDDLKHATVAELLGVQTATVRQRDKVLRDEWTTVARNQYAEHPTPLPERRTNIQWEPSEALTAYIRDRWRKDIHEYLGIVTIAFREDIGYLSQILGSERTYAADAHASSRILSPYQDAQIDKWYAAGMSMREIARDLGVAYHLVTEYVKSGRTSAAA